MTNELTLALLIVLPFISDFAKRLDLDIAQPVTTASVARAHLRLRNSVPEGRVVLTNGFEFWYRNGFVDAFESPTALNRILSPTKYKSHLGSSKLSKSEAVAVARNCLTKLGYSPEELYSHYDPIIEPPPKLPGGVIPRYKIRWMMPHWKDMPSVDVEVNSASAKVERISILNSDVWKIKPALREEGRPPTHEELETLSRQMWPEIKRYCGLLDLPLARDADTNAVSGIRCALEKEPLFMSILLTNQYSFNWSGDRIESFSAPDLFFQVHRPNLAALKGKARMTEAQAREKVRKALRELGYDLNALGVTRPPEVLRPQGPSGRQIPRVQFEWKDVQGGSQHSWVYAEVDLAARAIKYLHVESLKPPKRTHVPKQPKQDHDPEGSP